jgi:hypothetical protein
VEGIGMTLRRLRITVRIADLRAEVRIWDTQQTYYPL